MSFKNFILLCPMNIENILMMSFYTLRSIVAFKSENSIKMALSRKIVRDVYMIHNNRKYKFGHQLHQLSCSARQDNVDKMVSGVIVSPDLKRWYILLQLRISSFIRLHQFNTMLITSSKVHNCIIGYCQLTLKLVKACYHV